MNEKQRNLITGHLPQSVGTTTDRERGGRAASRSLTLLRDQNKVKLAASWRAELQLPIRWATYLRRVDQPARANSADTRPHTAAASGPTHCKAQRRAGVMPRDRMIPQCNQVKEDLQSQNGGEDPRISHADRHTVQTTQARRHTLMPTPKEMRRNRTHTHLSSYIADSSAPQSAPRTHTWCESSEKEGKGMDRRPSCHTTFTQVLYLSTILRYLYFTWVFPFDATLYFHSTTFQSEILYFLLHYIYLQL